MRGPMKTFLLHARWVVVLAVIAGLALPAHQGRAENEHRVSLGETLSGIAMRWGVDLGLIASRNGINDVNRVIAGQTLYIPGVGVVGATDGNGEHRIQLGENLYGIAARYGTTVSAIIDANGIENPDRIVSGQVLQIPGGGSGGSGGTGGASTGSGTHTVAAGDSLTSIAARYGVMIGDLIRANDVTNPNLLRIGTVLQIPGGGSGSSQPAVNIEQALIDAEREFGLPTGLVRAVAMQESGWQQHVVSVAGAVGVMQIMPATGDWLVRDLLPDAADWRTDARDNIRIGAALLGFNLRYYGGDIDLALAAYYQGHGNIVMFGVFGETWGYIENVRAIVGWYA